MGTHRIEVYIEKIIPLRQKWNVRDLEWEYRPLPQYPVNGASDVAGGRDAIESQSKTYFLPDDGERRSEWFWELMEFCRVHFD